MPLKCKSICKNCGEELLENANYKVKIIKAKKVPVKALKYRNNEELNLNDSIWGMNRFQRYLMKKAHPKNYMQITCGNCLDISKLEMKKPMKRTKGANSSIKLNVSQTPTSPGSSKKKKKRNREINAGLIIPPSLANSFVKSEPSTPTVTKTPFSFATSTPKLFENKPLSTITKKINKVKEKERDFNKLKAKLIKSNNKSSTSQMRSLKDFLSN